MHEGKRRKRAARPLALLARLAGVPALAEFRPGRRWAGQLAAVRGAIFFALASGRGGHVPVYLHAAQWTALATAGLLACSFVIGFGLPRRAREQ